MTTLRISITKEVLEATKDCYKELGKNCAFSYAVREIWPNAGSCNEYISPFYYLGGDSVKHRIYHKYKEFIDTFDFATPAERAAMQPFSFEIEVPDEVINEINIEEIRDIIKNSKTLELVK